MQKQRIAIIGAGPSGLAALRAFESAERAGAEVPEIVCYEKQDDWGGQWNYSWRTGIDQYGEPVHSSMYRNLWSNAPKEALEFAEYTFDEHFGRPVSSYPPREVLWDYIDGRLRSSKAKDKVKFATAARWVQHHEDTDTFTVTVEDLKTRTTSSSEFDRVIVATGHFAYPNVPTFEGIETFPGSIEHAHDFRGAEKFADQRVLMIGSSYSAEDIGVQAYKMGARSVTLSYRTKAIGHDWPQGMEELPLVERFEGNKVHFVNGQVREFDAVVMCTGYIHNYPFLPSDLAIDSPNNVYPSGLYRGVVWQENPNLYYLGAQDQWFTFNMFDAQAWYVRDLILDRAELPSAGDRAAHIQTWVKRFHDLSTEAEEVRFQADYIRDLIDNSDYPMFDLDAVVEIFLAWVRDKKENVLTYRDKQHRSVMTGTMSARHHTPWIRELDDSLQRYLSQPEKDEIEKMMDDEDVVKSVRTK
ncbi:NAD(P)-binding domain-containing protein [Enteractinococcus coprophilus]|uniref:Trimethylamine monooxygenase n=1 Tax=Enteractinococcus coprophilus TaxID=1027633 RepID=A0A543AMZ1_9MICC|nr:NAD(P)/FAD-dependent oxidoreductase [Enteractinococcus coprophilus]TQL73943.1 trimethylamine monooxygenase [Enteractinococcus coprophilus]